MDCQNNLCRQRDRDYIKLSVEHHHLQRNLRAADKKKEFLITRCYSYDDGLCMANHDRICRLQCFSLECNIIEEKTKDEVLVFE